MRRRATIPAALAALAAAAALAAHGGSAKPEEAAPGVPITAGAAAGYVSDRACGACHEPLWRSYQEVGMARSFFRPTPARRIEDLAAPPFFHAPSRQYFQIAPRGDGLLFRRWQVDDEGRPIHLFEQPVDWILGSGHHARSYLYRTPDGALFQLPLAWYSQEGKWGMSPGYDRADHDGVLRRVRRECLFCHNAYPEVAAGSDAAQAAQLFPAELPEGTGCQRCHGPGAEHVRRASGGAEDRDSVRAAIVNPARLTPALRDDVCNQCHLQPLVALPGVRRLGRGDFSFRPGEPLPDYQPMVDASEDGEGAAGRFEINHQAYRLRQSRCFLASAGKLSCRTCHDPHRHVPEAERVAHFRAACLTCHGEADCTRDPGRPRPAGVVAPGGGRSESASEAGEIDRGSLRFAPPAGATTPAPSGGLSESAAPADCVSCHMPKRRPRDVVHTVMTDHLIRRRPGGPELVAARAESDPILTGVELLEPERLPAAAREVYRTLPVARTGASQAAVDHLEKLAATPTWAADTDLKLELGAAELRLRRYAAAARILEELAQRTPSAPVLGWLGIARQGLGQPKGAEEAMRAALARPEGEKAEVAARLGQLLAGQGRHAEAIALFTEATALRPNLAAAWLGLGESQAALCREEAAQESFSRAVTIDPALASRKPPAVSSCPGAVGGLERR